MSEVDMIIESLKNSGKKVEEFYMSNKTSDKNVGSIDEDVKRCNELTKVKHANWIGISNQLAILHILAEREQKDKRIKELEADLYSANEIISDLIDNIPKQVVIDLIENETINISGFECIAVEDLQELLEGRNENG